MKAPLEIGIEKDAYRKNDALDGFLSLT